MVFCGFASTNPIQRRKPRNPCHFDLREKSGKFNRTTMVEIRNCFENLNGDSKPFIVEYVYDIQ